MEEREEGIGTFRLSSDELKLYRSKRALVEAMLQSPASQGASMGDVRFAITELWDHEASLLSKHDMDMWHIWIIDPVTGTIHEGETRAAE